MLSFAAKSCKHCIDVLNHRPIAAHAHTRLLAVQPQLQCVRIDFKARWCIWKLRLSAPAMHQKLNIISHKALASIGLYHYAPSWMGKQIESLPSGGCLQTWQECPGGFMFLCSLHGIEWLAKSIWIAGCVIMPLHEWVSGVLSPSWAPTNPWEGPNGVHDSA